jgi:hypothetical protein
LLVCSRAEWNGGWDDGVFFSGCEQGLDIYELWTFVWSINGLISSIHILTGPDEVAVVGVQDKRCTHQP